MLTYAKRHPRYLAIAAAGLFCITLIAWNHKPVYQEGDKMNNQDTVPAQSPGTSTQRDLNIELEKLERAIERLENLKKGDLDQIQARVLEQLNRINIEEMTKEAGLAMKAIDLNKINIETQKALKVMDAEVMQKALIAIDAEPVQKALMAIDAEVVQKQVNEAMVAVKIDTNAVQKAMSEVKIAIDKELVEMKDINIEEMQDINTTEINEAMDAVKVELQKAKSALKAENYNFKKELDNIKSNIQDAKKEIRGYQDMIYSMEKEGLLDTKSDYKLAYRDGSIYINDKKQTSAVSAKYGKYLKNNITIRKENGRFNIDSNQLKID